VLLPGLLLTCRKALGHTSTTIGMPLVRTGMLEGSIGRLEKPALRRSAGYTGLGRIVTALGLGTESDIEIDAVVSICAWIYSRSPLVFVLLMSLLRHPRSGLLTTPLYGLSITLVKVIHLSTEIESCDILV
jgi:hypothetical protein